MNARISGFYDEISGSLDRQIEAAKRLGGSFICPRKIDGRSIAEIGAKEFARSFKPRLDAAGIGFSSIGSPLGKIDVDDDAGFERQLGQLKELVEIARMMDCAYIRVFSFYYGRRDPDSILGGVLEKLGAFLETVRGSGVRLMHENEKRIYGDVPERVLRLRERLASPDLALCFDDSNFVQCGSDPVAAFHMLKDHVEYYHVKDCGRHGVEVPVGTGVGGYERILHELGERGYEGFLTLEPHTFKYAMLKLPVYLAPLGFLLFRNHYRTFREIDRAMGVAALRPVSRREAFEWQHSRLAELLERA